MNKRFAIFVGFIVVIISYFYFYPPDITVHEVEATAPEKPESVPEEALWVGGPDGGVFVLIFRADEGAYSGTVYAENGSVLYQGPFRYSGDADFDVSSQSNYSFWDGNFLALRNGEKLKAIYEDGPTPESVGTNSSLPAQCRMIPANRQITHNRPLDHAIGSLKSHLKPKRPVTF